MRGESEKATWPVRVGLQCATCLRRHLIVGKSLAGAQRSATRAGWYTDDDDWQGWERSRHVIPATCHRCMPELPDGRT